MPYGFIACEYNPLHNGHKYQINKTKELGADGVICIMSGNFVQRGDIAVANKHTRAKAALASGADLVIELPLKYAISTACYFAEGFVRTVKASGLEGFVCCGATSSADDIKLLCNTAFSQDAEAFVRQQLSLGINYPRAKARYIREILGTEYERMFNEPNNILAIEYLNAIGRIAPNINFQTIERIGAAHDCEYSVGNFSNASLLRKIIYESIDSESPLSHISSFIPSEVLEIFNEDYINGNFPVNIERFNSVCMARLINLTGNDFSQINNVNGGIENKILKCIRSSSDVNEIAHCTKSKMYTHSRIRQILLSAVLGVKRSDLLNGPSYIRILGFNDIGRRIINEMKTKADLPVIGNLSQLNSTNPQIRRDSDLDYSAGRIYGLCLENCKSANPEFSTPPIYYK